MNDELDPEEPSMEEMKEMLEEKKHLSLEFAKLCAKLQNDGHSSHSILSSVVEFAGITMGSHLVSKEHIPNIVTHFVESINMGMHIKENMASDIELN